jgi:circadian clock protein KaiC
VAGPPATATENGVSFTDLQFSADVISFLTDASITQRYVEMQGELRKVIDVVKMQGSQHDKTLRLYEITEHGLELGRA